MREIGAVDQKLWACVLEGFGYKSSLMNWKPGILKNGIERDKEQVCSVLLRCKGTRIGRTPVI